ncbi:DUF2079 domain-containing protein [Schumannella soli]|uniref:DUF2079 domain-containing protein n=1 Tax=Schumannella soli TaxID=2590779 RepID=UPI0015E8723F|nr:DUF2079 domain-containing protein [Schumannella soli]
MGIFTQLAKAYSRWEAPIVPIKGDGFNLLGDHFHPALVLLGPIYALFPSGLTLLVVQAVCFAISAGIVASAATRSLGVIPGLCFGITLGLSWGLQTAAEAQFHEIAFAVPLLAYSCSALADSRYRAAAIAAAPLVFVKEDLGITVAAIAVLLTWRSHDRRWLYLAAWGIVWFIIAVGIVLPLVNSNGRYAYGFSEAGTDPVAALLTGLTAGPKYEVVVLLIAVTAGLALRSPIVLLTLPTLAWRFVSSNENYWGTTWHYNAVLMPIIVVAALDSAIRLTHAHGDARSRVAGGTVLFAPVVAIGLTLAFPLGQSLQPTSNAIREASAAAVLKQVTAGARVESDITLLAYLAPRSTAYWSGNTRNPVPDFYVVDRGLQLDPLGRGAVEAAEDSHPGQRFELVYDSADFQVAAHAD